MLGVGLAGGRALAHGWEVVLLVGLGPRPEAVEDETRVPRRGGAGGEARARPAVREARVGHDGGHPQEPPAEEVLLRAEERLEGGVRREGRGLVEAHGQAPRGARRERRHDHRGHGDGGGGRRRPEGGAQACQGGPGRAPWARGAPDPVTSRPVGPLAPAGLASPRAGAGEARARGIL